MRVREILEVRWAVASSSPGQGQGPPQAPQLLHRHRIEAAQGLCHDGDEGNVLHPAELLCVPHLLVVGNHHGVVGYPNIVETTNPKICAILAQN